MAVCCESRTSVLAGTGEADAKTERRRTPGRAHWKGLLVRGAQFVLGNWFLYYVVL